MRHQINLPVGDQAGPRKLQPVYQADTRWIGPCLNDLKALPNFEDQSSWPIA